MGESIKIPGARGGGELLLLREHVVYGVFQGMLSGDSAKPILDFYESLMVRGAAITSFIDASEVSSVDSEFRDRASGWSKSHPNKNETHVLLRSKMVEMAISLMNLFSGRPGMHAYTDRAKWEGAAKKLGVTIPDRPTATAR